MIILHYLTVPLFRFTPKLSQKEYELLNYVQFPHDSSYNFCIVTDSLQLLFLFKYTSDNLYLKKLFVYQNIIDLKQLREAITKIKTFVDGCFFLSDSISTREYFLKDEVLKSSDFIHRLDTMNRFHKDYFYNQGIGKIYGKINMGMNSYGIDISLYNSRFVEEPKIEKSNFKRLDILRLEASFSSSLRSRFNSFDFIISDEIIILEKVWYHAAYRK